MNVAISSKGPDLTSTVSRRFGSAQYFLIVDLETETLTAVKNPGATAQRGTGVLAATLLLGRDTQVLLTGYCSPTMRQKLQDNGVQVISGLTGTAHDALQRYKEGRMGSRDLELGGKRWLQAVLSGDSLRAAARAEGRLFCPSLRASFRLGRSTRGIRCLKT